MSIDRNSPDNFADLAAPHADRIAAAHPGSYLGEMIADARVSMDIVAQDIGVPTARLGEVIKGQSPVDADLALRLGRYWQTTADLWLGLQANYDLDTARTALASTLDRIIPRSDAA